MSHGRALRERSLPEADRWVNSTFHRRTCRTRVADMAARDRSWSENYRIITILCLEKVYKTSLFVLNKQFIFPDGLGPGLGHSQDQKSLP